MFSKQRIIRQREVLELFGISRSGLYQKLKDGSFPRQINIGARAVGWLESEVMTVFYAMVAGKKNEQIKVLVRELLESRVSGRHKALQHK